jgi:hypothetical protein
VPVQPMNVLCQVVGVVPQGVGATDDRASQSLAGTRGGVTCLVELVPPRV